CQQHSSWPQLTV
nr:immunoglobulin light chain junction region [Macaca mulatta]